MPRGRLIFPFIVELYQLDTVATEADPDGAGPLTSGYNEFFREPIKILGDPADQVGESARVESGPIQVEAQIEPEMFERLEMMLSGQSPDTRFAVVAHYANLERNGLVLSDGTPSIKKGDRLSRILSCRTGELVEPVPNPPGLFVRQTQPRSFGLGTERNLLLIEFEERSQSAVG